jgi:hypothetical protein
MDKRLYATTYDNAQGNRRLIKERFEMARMFQDSEKTLRTTPLKIHSCSTERDFY